MYKSLSTFDIKSSFGNTSECYNGGGLQKSYTIGNCSVEKSRGFKPSDRHDPQKNKFLTELSKQIWQKSNESSNVSKRIDLHKIFTPATDAEEILPKNRKLYASSAFYSPTLHPTVEDQVELARRISHSLSDISNKKSKGQSMYVNRKKRSVKWVHEGTGQDYHQYQPKPATSPSIVPAYSDAGKHRVQLNMHQEQVLEKYAKPSLKVVKTPWEAALESGSASTAFVEQPASQNKFYSPQSAALASLSPAPAPQYNDMSRVAPASPSHFTSSAIGSGSYEPMPQQKAPQWQQPPAVTTPRSSHIGSSQRELAYKPSLAQGWMAPSVSLPKELYVPKEIPLDSYAPPPTMNIQPSSQPWRSTYAAPDYGSAGAANNFSSAAPKPTFPLAGKKNTNGFSSYSPAPYASAQAPPKQQYWAPTSYQTVPQSTAQTAPPVNFNPSPLPYDKLAKFETPAEQTNWSTAPQSSAGRYLSPSPYGSSKVRNTSPAPFGAHSNTAATYSPAPAAYGSNTPTSSRPTSQQCSIYSTDGGYDNFMAPSTAQFPTARKNAGDLLHGPSYNNSARGWKSSGGSTGFAPQSSNYGGVGTYKAPPAHMALAAGNDLPYTDF